MLRMTRRWRVCSAVPVRLVRGQGVLPMVVAGWLPATTEGLPGWGLLDSPGQLLTLARALPVPRLAEGPVVGLDLQLQVWVCDP